MADLSSILAQGNALAAPPPIPVAPPERSDLKAGLLDYRASLNNAMALGAEGLGWDKTSQRLRDEAARGTAEAERVATPRIQTTEATGPVDAWNKSEMGPYLSDVVHNLPATLRRGLPAMAAPVVAGLAGTALSGGNPLVGLAAGSATMMPQTSGDIAARQYANEDNTDDVGTRVGKAAGLGAVSAVAQNVVPTWMGGKLVSGTVAKTVANKAAATVASTSARPTLAGSIARNLSEAVGGNAVAGAGAELANQVGAGEAIDPNRLGSAAIEGGIVGSVFAPLGIGGEMAGRGPRTRPANAIPVNEQGAPVAPGTPAGRKAAQDAAAAAKTAPEAAEAPAATGASTQASMDAARAGKGVADRLAAGEPVMDNLGDFASAVGEKASQMFDKGRETAAKWVQKTAQEYVKRRDLTPEQRATAEAAAANPGDASKHQAFGEMVSEFKRKDADIEVLDALDKDYPEPKRAEGGKQSASTAGVDARIAQITEPLMKGKHPEVQARANAVLRRLVASAGDEHGTMNEPAARRLLQLLGPQAHEMVQRVYDAVAPREAVADARMARHINHMQKVGERDSGLGKVIDSALPEDHKINVTHLKDALARWARGDDDVGSDARGRMHHESMRKQIEDMFGPKADKVFEALETYVKREDDKPGSTQNVKHDKDALDRGDQGSRRGDIAQEVGADYGDLDEGAMDPVYYGGGSNPLEMRQLVEAPDVYRAKHAKEGPAEKQIKKLLGNDELPEDLGGSGHRNVRFISEREYNRRHGIFNKDDPGSTTHGYIVNEEPNDPAKFNDNDYKATRLDAKKYPRATSKIQVLRHKKAEQDSTGAENKPERKAFLIDAVALTQRFMRNQETGTGDTNIVRSGKAFMDGILALNENLNERMPDGHRFIDEAGLAEMGLKAGDDLEEHGLTLLPDSLKIDKLGNTYGAMKKAFASRDTASKTKLTANEEAKLAALREGYKEASAEEQALRRSEAEEVFEKAKARELGLDLENDTTRRKTSPRNKGKAGVADVGKIPYSSEGYVIKGKDPKTGQPIYDLSARTQADEFFDQEGMAKAHAAIDQLGDVHGGIDVGKVQQRDRDRYKAKILAKGDKATPQEKARLAAMEVRNEARTVPDARTGKNDTTTFDPSGSGRTEISPDENPHLAQAVAGPHEQNLPRGLNMDETPHSIDLSRAFKDEAEQKALLDYSASLGRRDTAIGRKIGKRLRLLVENADSLAQKDLRRLKGLANMNEEPSVAATLINDLSRKYKDTILDQQETRNDPQGLVERTVRKSHGGEDSAGAPTKPVSTRPVPEPAPLVKKGNKAYEGHNKGTPSAMLKESLGTHVPDLINPAERINEALKAGDVPEVDMKTPRGRKAARDFIASHKEYEVTYEDGKPVLTKVESSLKEDPQSPKALAAKEAALNQAVTSSDPALIHELRTTDDIHGLQRTVDHIADTAPDSAAMKAANARMSEISLDDDAAYQMTLKSKQSAAAATGTQTISALRRQAIRDHIEKVLGPQVKVAFKNIMHEGDFTPLVQMANGIHDLIRISVHSQDPMGTAYHESLHGLVNNLRKAGLHEMVGVLQQAADSTYVRQQVEKLMGSDPAVMKQLRGADPEERIAYMYQLWANGQLKLENKPQGIVTKLMNMLNKVLGVWSNDERATHIMKYFTEGDYAKDMHDRDLVMAKAMEVKSNKVMEGIKTLTKPMTNLSDSVLAAGGQRLRDLENPALDRMVDLIKRKAGDTKSDDPGYIAASRLEKTVRMNEIGSVLADLTDAQRAEALEDLQTGVKAATPEARIAAHLTREFLQIMHKYLTDAGVQIGNLNKDYFPRVWDIHHISKNQQAFRAMLDKYVQRGDLTDVEANDFTRKLMTTQGNEFDVNTTRPGFQANKERVYSFIEHGDAAPFQNKDLFRTVNDYVTQATRRAEWTRRFQGEDALPRIFEKAREAGATDAHIQQAERYLQGITGVLGDSMSPTLRRFQGNMMVYQNIRLLPLAIFSSLIDAQGLMVRGGTGAEAWQAFKYGIKEIRNNLREVPKSDMHAELAETMGVIDNAVLVATLGEAYQQGMVGETGRKINDKFFKYNLMEGWNRSMRIAATHTAVNFIAKHANGMYSKHSMRFLDEMGLAPNDLHFKADGTLKLHEGDGLSPEQAHKMRVAVNQWVDSAILRPDAADKPTWGNDPRFALIFHLKQFTYSFQHTILNRTMHEFRQGNYSPMLALASYVPVMLAADGLKGLLTTGGIPARKENWDMLEHLGDAFHRAGLAGVSQFKHDIYSEVMKGNTGLGAIQGPTLDQLSGAVEAIRGVKSWKSFTLDSMPANKLYNSH